MGVSSNRAMRFCCAGEEVVKLSTINAARKGLFAVLSVVCEANNRSSLGESGEKEGKDVNDLSETDDAELEIWDGYLRGLI